MRKPLLPLAFAVIASSCGAFSPSTRGIATTRRRRTKPPRLDVATRDREDAPPTTIDDRRSPAAPSSLGADDDDDDGRIVRLELEARASSGLRCDSELPRILDVVASVCGEYGVPLDVANTKCEESPCRCEAVPGALGRVLLLDVCGLPSNCDVDENDLIAELKVDLSERIDAALSGEGSENGQPILLAFRRGGDDDFALADAIEKEVTDYGLREGVDEVCSVEDEACFVHPLQFEIYCFPSSVIEIDGDVIESVSSPVETRFDTSSILVFDKLLDKSLRRRLLNVVKGHLEDRPAAGEEDEKGPDEGRWVRGGLADVAGEGDEREGGSCWGLSDDAVMDVCYGDHPAVAEFESKLAQLFPDFVVSRLPEAVLGGCVSPLTANAPTHGDSFNYHIDADPMQAPPSPWMDVFGRYPNRSEGKPRFVSVLAYLNDEWVAEDWGAPTRFLDPPTGETIDVSPKPGRCVVMDQDISHTVVAPDVEAGRRPRYSLVWKLVLHPREEGQEMDLSCGRGGLWPEPFVVGSAAGGMPNPSEER